ncbi:hypothetical protein OH76DRAFT_1486530 [Lentinus brumalis]|uniref:Uncharacterized protein n=1 Tax=Lentinus brumalis TaxID=2498619 RepID=A0A371CY75_9APHY|nr:hypothetical protein OH76DRAFT_1486530 [Polyporus brumalis]
MASGTPDGVTVASHRLSVEILAAIVDLSDMDSLLVWRRTCQHLSNRVHTILQRLLHAVITHYLPRPSVFVDLLRQYAAVIVDEAALAFWLRDLTVLRNTLVISVPARNFAAIRKTMRRAYTLKSTSATIYHPRELPDTLRFHVPLMSNRYVLLQRVREECLESGTDHAIGYLARTPHTALMNFVGADVFGSLVPSLTLRRRAHLAVPWSWMPTVHRAPILHLLAHGAFCFSSEPSDLLDLAELQAAFVDASLRAALACPCVPRYFGGEGALVDCFRVKYAEAPRGLISKYGLATRPGACNLNNSTHVVALYFTTFVHPATVRHNLQ